MAIAATVSGEGATEAAQLEVVKDVPDALGDGNQLQLFGDAQDTSDQRRLAAAFADAIHE
jgi:hypothetical protein